MPARKRSRTQRWRCPVCLRESHTEHIPYQPSTEEGADIEYCRHQRKLIPEDPLAFRCVSCGDVTRWSFADGEPHEHFTPTGIPDQEGLSSRLRMIVHAWPIAAWVLDAESGSFLAVNDEFCHLTGYPEPELMNTTMFLLVPREDEALAATAICAAHEPRMPVEWRLLHRTGKVLRIVCRYRPLRFLDPDGQMVHCFLGAAVNTMLPAVPAERFYREMP